MTEYVVIQTGESMGANLRILGNTSAKSAEKAVEKVTSRKVEKDTYRDAPKVGYVAVAESNWNEFRPL